MIVFLINGLSYSGKSTIVKKCCEKNSNFNIVKSWTTRKKRYANDDDHSFTSKIELGKKMLIKPYIASTMIDNNVYCAFEEQFKEEFINFYIVDDLGFLNAYNHTWTEMKDVNYVSVRIKRDLNNFKNNNRIKRFDSFLDDSVFDYIILNENLNTSIEKLQEIINNEIN